MKSKRIQSLVELIDPDKQELWDLCCDHGGIGLAALEKYPHLKVNFVDVVPGIINRLRERLATDITNGPFSFYQADICKITIPTNSSIILAGVGGLLTIEFLQNYADTNNQLIVCAHQKIHDLRWYLNEQKIGISEETLIHDAGKYYEILELDFNNFQDSPANIIGNSMWDFSNLEHKKYASKYSEYYGLKVQHSNDFKAKAFLNLFKTLMDKF